MSWQTSTGATRQLGPCEVVGVGSRAYPAVWVQKNHQAASRFRRVKEGVGRSASAIFFKAKGGFPFAVAT